jgi:hypothetical protein
MADHRRHRSVQGIVPQHFLHAVKLYGGSLEGLLVLDSLMFVLLFLRSEFDPAFHELTSSGLLKKGGEGLAGPMQLATDSVGGLFGERADLFVAQFFVGDQQ